MKSKTHRGLGTTVSAMKRIVAAVSVLLVIGACGGNKTPDRAGSAAPKGATSSYSTLSKGDLKSVVLSIDDMPTGFAVDPDPSDDDDDDFTSGDPGCKALVEASDAKNETVAHKDASFTQGDFGPFVSESVSIQKKGMASKGFRDARKGLSSCKSYVAGKGDDAAKFKVGAMSFPNLGDETVAYQLNGEASGYPFTGHLVAVRLGDNIVLVTGVGIGGSTLEPASLEKIARAAVKKVKEKTS
ncbi:MAG: hypothetical protein JWQ70_1107 [Aeromicrobium sp.]|nr:hypothetical protein [Aeromicrobium sp.]